MVTCRRGLHQYERRPGAGCPACKLDRERERFASDDYRKRRTEQIKEWRKRATAYVDRERLRLVRWRKANRQHAYATLKNWRAKHPQLQRLQVARRRARIRGSTGPGVTAAQWAAICARYTDPQGNITCAYCWRKCAATIDHVVPISRGGLDAPDNVVPACRRCNCSKGAKLLSEWRAQNSQENPTG